MTVKLICFEPWRGVGITPYDSGFADRMRHWIIAHKLSLIIKDLQIIVEEKFWPELLLLDFPNTIPQNVHSLKLSKGQLIPISYEEVEQIISTEDNNFLTSSDEVHYYFNFSIHRVNDIYIKQNLRYDSIAHEAISKIKFKLPIVSDFMQREFSDCCFIHLRRGNGTFPTLKFLSEMERFLSKETVDSYWKTFHSNRLGHSINSKEYKYFDSLLEKNTDKKYLNSIGGDSGWANDYKITADSDYFNLIINIIFKDNSDQKIYISSDIPQKYYSYYYDNFPHNVIDKTFYFEKFLNFYTNVLPAKKFNKKYSIPIFKVFENVFDLMVGCYSEIIVRSGSNWSKIASLYKKKKIIQSSRITSINSLEEWTFVDQDIDFTD